jgi:hypothetical protein
MALTSIWCCVLQRHITRVSNVENEVVAVVCPEVDVPRGACRLKTIALRGGFVSDLLRLDDANPIETSAPRCPLA